METTLHATSTTPPSAAEGPKALVGPRGFVTAHCCGTVLVNFGAEVFKIEQPGFGNSLKQFGLITSCGDSLVWLSLAPNKKAISLDRRKPEGVELFNKHVPADELFERLAIVNSQLELTRRPCSVLGLQGFGLGPGERHRRHLRLSGGQEHLRQRRRGAGFRPVHFAIATWARTVPLQPSPVPHGLSDGLARRRSK